MSQKRELEKLTGLDNLFGDEEEQLLSETTLPISAIILPPSQPRRYFDPKKLQSLADSIKQEGLLEPILVRPVGELNTTVLKSGVIPTQLAYELIAGERRIEASKLAEKTDIRVHIINCDEKTARKLRLIENLQREDLNAFEETIGILDFISSELEVESNTAVSLLYQMNNETKGNSNHNVMVSEEALVIQTIFLQIGKISWESFVSNRLPLLKLPQDIQITLEKGQIEYTKAQVIARVKDNEKRQNILKKAIKENLSLSAIKELVGDILQIQSENKPQSPQQQNKERASKIYKSLLKSKIWDDEKKVKKVNRLFDQIEALLEEKKEDAS
ncbi:ParB/RepB/Spo0J family partition protein [Nostoc sp. CHAB 5784]|uniref:ParB/RepB/Spo0J family partition protein n=1 Tax=Nostoc mirabile TaxID=2907820 RepID=UPI001E4AAC30|nr:ParB/RepB/Spo0J family partition protein [Nostoc mirabile]MCC5668536.1 ParB/RepB/Spo0J family partition protein [Nostoc mirabile CHAB5784]